MPINFGTLSPVDYGLKTPEITPTMKRMADVLTLADLMDARKKQKINEELSGKLGRLASKSYELPTETTANLPSVQGLNFPLKFDPNTFYAQQQSPEVAQDTIPQEQSQEVTSQGLNFPLKFDPSIKPEYPTAKYAGTVGQNELARRMPVPIPGQSIQPEPIQSNPIVNVETPELLDAQKRALNELTTQPSISQSLEGYFEPNQLNLPLKFDPNKFYSDAKNQQPNIPQSSDVPDIVTDQVPNIIPISAPVKSTPTGARSSVADINTSKPYEPDFLTFTPQEKAILNQAYQYGFDYGQPIYEKMLANKKMMAETYKAQSEGLGKFNKPEDTVRKFKLEAQKHQKISNMLQQATTTDDLSAAIERAREYGFDEESLPNNPQKIQSWIAEDQGIQQQLSMLRKDVLTGAKGKFPSITIKGQTIPQPTQGEFYAAKMLKGDAPPDFSFVKGRGQDNQIVINDIWANLQKMDPNFSPAMAQADYKYWTTPKTKQQRQAIDAFVGLAQKAKEGADEFKNSGIKLINGAILRARLAAGDVGAAKYISQMGVLVEDLGKAVAGGNAMTDDQLKFASSILAKDYTPDQLKAAIDMALTGAMERKYSIYSQGGIYGRNNAADDPFLTDEMRDAIINGRKINFNEKSPAIKSKNSSQVNNVKEFVTDPKTGKLILKKVGK